MPPCPEVAVNPTLVMRRMEFPEEAMSLLVRMANPVRLEVRVCAEVKSAMLVALNATLLMSVTVGPVYALNPFVASFSRKKGVPAEFTPMAMIAVGYQAEPDVLDEVTKKKELTVRARKPLSERFFEGGLGKPVKL